VFEIREPVATKDSDYKFVFDQVTQFSPNLGKISRSAGTGAGLLFKDSAIPLAIFTLEKCTAVSPHIHPNGAETIFVLEGEWHLAPRWLHSCTPHLLQHSMPSVKAPAHLTSPGAASCRQGAHLPVPW
jgi:hypothetical protein